MVVLTLALSAWAYFECIHLLGFPDGHVSEPHRLRRVLAFVLLGVNALAATYYAIGLASTRPRRWHRVAIAHAVLAGLLLTWIVRYSAANAAA